MVKNYVTRHQALKEFLLMTNVLDSDIRTPALRHHRIDLAVRLVLQYAAGKVHCFPALVWAHLMYLVS